MVSAATEIDHVGQAGNPDGSIPSRDRAPVSQLPAAIVAPSGDARVVQYGAGMVDATRDLPSQEEGLSHGQGIDLPARECPGPV